MKITIKKLDILNVLSSIQGLTGRKSNLAITTNVLLQTIDSGVVISATDLETGFEGTYPAIVENEGVIAINSRKFFEIVRDFPSEDVIINEIENRWIEIGNQNVEYHIVGSSFDDFPQIPKIEDIPLISMESVIFKRMIGIANIIQPQSEEKREHILGVNFEKLIIDDEKKIRLVSTDSKRLSKVDYPCESHEDFSAENGTVLIPKKGLSEVYKFLDDFGSVSIGIKDDHFILKKENETVLVKLLEGEFPQYEQILEKDDDSAIEINKNLFHMLLKRMSILSSEDYKSVIFYFKDNKLVVTATNPEIGESREDISIDFERDSIEVAFNPKYFLDTLNTIKDDIVLLYIEDSQSPCLVKGQNDDNSLSVIMPMKI